MFIIVIRRTKLQINLHSGQEEKEDEEKIKTIIYKRIETDDGHAIYIICMIKYYEEKQI